MSDQKIGYRDTDVDLAGQEFEDWEKAKTIVEKPKAGETVEWICPPRADKPPTPFKKGIFVHWVKNPLNLDEIIAVGICESKTFNRPCVVCPVVSKLKKTGAEADKKVADELSAKEYIVANAIPLEEDKPRVRPLQIMVDPYKELSRILRDRTKGTDFTHPDKGRPVIFTKSGSGKLGTEYSARLALEQRPLDRKYRHLLDELPDLDACFQRFEDPVAIGKMLAGEIDDRPAAPQREAAPASRQLEAGSAPAGSVDVYDPISDEWMTPEALHRLQEARRERAGRK